LALLPPSFLSSSPATVRSARTGDRQGNKRRVGAARRRSRGHGPARLDGTRARATVADKVMKSGETAGQGNGPPTRRPYGKRSAQARIEESGPEASAERSEGTMEALQGRDAAGGSMRYAHDSATGHLPGGRGRPDCTCVGTSESVHRQSLGYRQIRQGSIRCEGSKTSRTRP
jgi:hypothetical protein